MTLPYRIVWVDDSPAWVDSALPDVEEFLEELGYVIQAQRHESAEGLAVDLAQADVDLIVVDFNLEGGNGNDLINELRDLNNFKEIVFYSQTPLPVDRLDGVFRCTRDDAVETIKRVIQNSLHKLSDLGVVRGLVIATAIDLEMKIEEILVGLLGDGGELFETRVLNKGFLQLQSKVSFLCGVVKDRVKKLEGAEKRDLQAAQEILTTFDKEVVRRRNSLAHAKRREENGEVVLAGFGPEKDAVFDAKWVAELRKNLEKHGKNLDVVSKLLAQ